MSVRVVTVVPISTSLPEDHLSYFTTREVALGDIVEIPIRKQIHTALVVDIEDVQKNKAELKDSSFSLRAISRVVGPSPFSQVFFQTLSLAKDYFFGSLSQIFYQSIPRVLLDSIKTLPKNQQEPKKDSKLKKEKLLFQNNYEERIVFYKSYIREAFARSESVRFCVPSIADAQRLEDHLSKGIKEYCVVLHSKKTKKHILDAWTKVATETHPLCLIHTTPFLVVPRDDVSTLIVEHESSPHYKGITKPFLDGRVLCETFAHISNIKLILADDLLRTETLIHHKNGNYGIIGNLQFRMSGNANQKIIDMRQSDKTKPVIGNELEEAIAQTYKTGGKTVLVALRGGLATTTVCRDCGTTLTHKGSPLTLHTDPKTGERYFKSKKWNEQLRANIVCQNCQGWNLVPLGIGTETVETALQSFSTPIPSIRIDRQSHTTQKQIKDSVDSFYAVEGGAVLVTTLQGIPFLEETVDLVGIVSLDTLFNIPQFNMYEQIMHCIMDTARISKDSFYIQTRYADQKILSILQSRRLFDFFEYDSEERKLWDYPPFSTIIKMTYEGPRKEIPALERYLKKVFSEYEIYIYHTSGKHPDTSVSHAVLKIPSKIWPLPWDQKDTLEQTQNLQKKLALFPNSWTVSVNPHSIF